MHSQAPFRGPSAKQAFVLLLAITFVGFSIWLKSSPNVTSGTSIASQGQVKLWVDPTPGWENQVKLATLGSFLFLLVVTSVALVVPARPMYAVRPVTRIAAKDVFLESRHWFRPPPLF